MGRINRIKLWFTIFLVGVPALVHALRTGSYVVDPANHSTFWIGPVSTTLPFVFLALLFLAHCERDKRSRSASAVSTFPRSAYWGAAMAWLAMMAFTLFLVSHPPGSKTSSTMAIAVMLTPFFYIPWLLAGYTVGALVGRFWGKWKYTKPLATA